MMTYAILPKIDDHIYGMLLGIHMAAPCTLLLCSCMDLCSAKPADAAAMPTAMQAQYIVHATARGVYKQSKGSMQSAS